MCVRAGHVAAEIQRVCAQGDVRDVALMSVSIVVFVWAAAMLYRVYAFSYAAAGLRPLVHLLAK